MKVLLFGILSEHIQTSKVPWESFKTVKELESFLMEQFPVLHNIPIQFAVNHQMVSSDFELKNVEELALMPPFSGG